MNPDRYEWEILIWSGSDFVEADVRAFAMSDRWHALKYFEEQIKQQKTWPEPYNQDRPYLTIRRYSIWHGEGEDEPEYDFDEYGDDLSNFSRIFRDLPKTIQSRCNKLISLDAAI